MLELKNISFAVPEKEIVRSVSFKAEKGKLLVITGPNGGGKSTLAKIIMGIEKPQTGKILLDGCDITPLSVTERARAGVGFAFQSPVRFKGLRVQDLLRLAAGKPLAAEEACVYLSEVGLCANSYIGREVNASLSGGELKRIEIAMLLARGTKLSIFDEPEAGIDLWSFGHLIACFKKIRARRDGTVIIISHQERILEIADKIVVIADGKLTDEGTKNEIMPKLLHGCMETCELLKGN
ncbi:MAG: ATP-binding cassette domain-containing protein [Firmicutes bacterium]|nr:ATP-binding cassette domain-containing protein [Bacillota bacterium]